MSEAEARASSEIPTEGPYHSLRIARVIRETHDSCSVIVEVPPHLKETFAYRAGQFLTFRVEVDGKRLVRCYSLASSPDTEDVHKVTVKRVVEGRVSNHVNDRWREGDVVDVMKPHGFFCLADRACPVVLFAAGSGITPIISIVKTALATTGRALSLLYANRDERSIIFERELSALQAAHPDRLRVVHSLDDRDGFVDVARALDFVAAPTDADFYVCGPGPFMDVVEQALQELGVGPERLFIERFESPELEEEEPAAAGEAGTRVTVVLDGVTTEITCHPGETILHAARREGLEPPFACEEAYCGCCMARVHEGEVDMKMNDGGIDRAQIEQGWVLTCQGLPRTATVRVEYPD